RQRRARRDRREWRAVGAANGSPAASGAVASPRRPGAGLRAHRQVDDLGEVRRRVAAVRDRHRGDEMLLEAGLDRGLDLLDPADDVLDLASRGAREKRDEGARAGRVACGADVREIAIRDEPEDHGVADVDMAPERAGEAEL